MSFAGYRLRYLPVRVRVPASGAGAEMHTCAATSAGPAAGTTSVTLGVRRPVYSVAVSAPSPRKRLKQATDLLDDFYGRPVLSPRYPPVDELVFTVLSQNTADVNTERTFASLKARFPEWTAARDASAEEIEEAIALGGLAHTKAPRIKKILEAISERTGAPDLGELDEMSDEEAQDVPRRAARRGAQDGRVRAALRARAAGHAGGHPRAPRRAAARHHRREGDAPTRRTRCSRELAGPDDAEQVYAVHVDFVRHGRRICHARRPACGECPLAPMCPSAGLV